MATVNKDFKIKSGLVVEGANGTINGYNILTESQDSVDFIVDTIGGTATPNNTPDTVVKRDSNGDFAAGIITADVIGDVTGTVSDISNHTTSELAEGSNLYFTNQRAIDATSASYDTAGSADNAYTNAVATAALDATSKADQAELDAIAAAELDATTKAGNALTSANQYTNSALQDYTKTSDLDTTVDGYGYLKSADLGDYATTSYVDTAVSGLVDSAPELLNTLNELAAAIGDDSNYATTVSNMIAGKQDNLTAGSNIDISNNTVSVTGLDSTDISDFNTAALSATSSAYDSAGSAYMAEENAISYTDNRIGTIPGTVAEFVNDAASTAESNANTYTDNAIGALTTDDIPEASIPVNQYFTDTRAKIAAADLLVNSTQENITITGTYMGLTVTAENGVANSTTDDLSEGDNNLYFTDERAIDAVSGVTIWPEAVVFNNLAKQVAATTTQLVASELTAYSWAKSDYRTAKFLVKTSYGVHTDVAEVLLTLDTSDNIAITEYAMVGTNGSAMTISADISGTDVRLRVTTVNNNSTVTVVGTLLA